MFSGQKHQEFIVIEENYNKLHFRDYDCPIKFVTEFQNSIEEYRKLGTVFEDLLIARFLAKLKLRIDMNLEIYILIIII